MENYAEGNVDNMIKNSLAQQISAAYPNLPDENKNTILNQKFNEIKEKGVIEQNGQTYYIDDMIEESANALKSNFKNEHDTTYLLAIDSYFYYRYYLNLIETGHVGFTVNEEGKEYDPYRMAPLGSTVSKSFHLYFAAFVYKVWHIVDGDLDPMKAFFFDPVIMATLAVIPAFFIVRKIAGSIGALFASIIVAIHPAFLTRTVGGFSDTDPYNVTLPLFITWFFLQMFWAEKLKHKLIFSGLAGLTVGLFAFAWGGWWFIFDFLLGAIACYLAYLLIINRAELKHGIKHYLSIPKIKYAIITSAAYIVFSGIFTSLITNATNFFSAPTQAVSFTALKTVGIKTLWPNVQTTVAELNPASLQSIISQMGLGNLVIFFIALTGLLFELMREKHVEKEKNLAYICISFLYFVILVWIQRSIPSTLYLILAIIPLIFIYYKRINYRDQFIIVSITWYAILLNFQSFLSSHMLFTMILLSLPVIIGIIYSLLKKYEINILFSLLLTMWFMATIYASSNGVRFLLLFVPAFCIAFGIAIGFMSQAIGVWLSRLIDFNKKYTVPIVAVIFFVILLIMPIKTSLGIAQSEIPSMNDQWYTSLTKIRDESSPDAIVNSWWDFGHWFITLAERGVTFDGAGQDAHMAHWIGKSLLENNERKAVGILRMVDCGNNDAFWTLNPFLNNDTVKSIDILNDIILLDREEAKSYLQNYISDEQSEDVLQYSHCTPPDNYYITSADMVGKAGVWAHFGSWDFRKSKLINIIHENSEYEAVEFIKTEYNMTDNEAQAFYLEAQSQGTGRDANTWIAPWPSYTSGLSSCSVNGNLIMCNTGLIFNMTSRDAAIQTGDGQSRPKSVAFVNEQGDFEVKEYNDNVLVMNGMEMGAVFIPDGRGGFNSILMHNDLVASTFNRLFYFNGHDMECFDMFYDTTDVTGSRIITWKVDWDCTSAEKIYLLEEEVQSTTVEETQETELVNETEEVVEDEELEEISENTTTEETTTEETTENSTETELNNS